MTPSVAILRPGAPAWLYAARRAARPSGAGPPFDASLGPAIRSSRQPAVHASIDPPCYAASSTDAPA